MNRKMSVVLASVSLVALALLGSVYGGEGDKVDLRLRLQPGQEFGVRKSGERSTTIRVSGVERKVRRTVAFSCLYRVLDVDEEGVATLQCTYKDVVVEVDDSMVKVSPPAEQATPQESATAQAFAGGEGQSLTFRVAPDGRILETKGLDELRKHMLERFAGARGTEALYLREQLYERFDGGPFNEHLLVMADLYPGGPVAVGDFWEKEEPVVYGNFPMVTRSKTTLKERRGGYAVLEVRSGIKSEADIASGEFVAHYRGTGAEDGSFQLDEATGWMLSGTLSMTFSGVLHLDVPKGLMPPQPEQQVSVKTLTTFEPLEQAEGTPSQ